MKNPDRLLKDIINLKKDFEAQGLKLPPGLAGMYGEILVFKHLRNRCKNRFTVTYSSGHKSADIQVSDQDRQLNIEVKTSRLKDEGFGYWYGAALNVKKCKIAGHRKVHNHPKKGEVSGDFCYFDYLVFVALSDDFLNANYYVIPRIFFQKNEAGLRNTDKRFSSPTHRVIISDGKTTLKIPAKQLRLVKATEAFKDCWDLI